METATAEHVKDTLLILGFVVGMASALASLAVNLVLLRRTGETQPREIVGGELTTREAEDFVPRQQCSSLHATLGARLGRLEAELGGLHTRINAVSAEVQHAGEARAGKIHQRIDDLVRLASGQESLLHRLVEEFDQFKARPHR